MTETALTILYIAAAFAVSAAIALHPIKSDDGSWPPPCFSKVCLA